jgi:hypothetical protein
MLRVGGMGSIHSHQRTMTLRKPGPELIHSPKTLHMLLTGD